MKRPIVQIILVGFGLMLFTLLVFWPATHGEFLNYDDQEYITNNPQVRDGLTWNGFFWALSTGHAANWHPLTWISHMLDWQVFGELPAGHHFTSIALHALNTVLLFAGLLAATGARGRAATVALIFAVHPLRVESVAWLAERKDVLSASFGLLSLIAYVQYTKLRDVIVTESPGSPSRTDRRHSEQAAGTAGAVSSTWRVTAWYLSAVVLHVLGLMSKPMLVTLPLLLLLLDYWPLRRFGQGGVKRASLAPLLLEKLPFLIATVLSCVITLRVQSQATMQLASLSVYDRVSNAFIAYCRYLGKAIWPFDLAVPYPHPGHWSPWLAAAAALVLVCVTIAVMRASARFPFLVTGWGWYVIGLLPVIGLIQVGAQAMADRYSYLPLIGVSIAGVWGVAEWIRQRPQLTRVTVAGVGVLISLWTLRTRTQIAVWRDTESLFTHAVRTTTNNWVAHYNLALLALDRYQQQHRRDLTQIGTLPAQPPGAATRRNYLAEVISHCRAALVARPGNADIHVTLAKALTETGQWTEARPQLEQALALAPANAEARAILAETLQRQGDEPGAKAQYRAALELRPDWDAVQNNLAWLLATSRDAAVRDGSNAVRLASRACELTGRTNFWYLQTLAAAQAEAGDFRGALTTTERARNVAVETGAAELIKRTEIRAELFKKRGPVRE